MIDGRERERRRRLNAIGWIKDATGKITLGLVVLAAGSIMAGVVTFLMGHDSKMEMAGSRVMAE